VLPLSIVAEFVFSFFRGRCLGFSCAASPVAVACAVHFCGEARSAESLKTRDDNGIQNTNPTAVITKTEEHDTDRAGRRLLREVLEPLGVVNEVQMDYGFDFNVEVFDGQNPTGLCFMYS
jgi:hypothetical protein